MMCSTCVWVVALAGIWPRAECCSTNLLSSSLSNFSEGKKFLPSCATPYHRQMSEVFVGCPLPLLMLSNPKYAQMDRLYCRSRPTCVSGVAPKRHNCTYQWQSSFAALLVSRPRNRFSVRAFSAELTYLEPTVWAVWKRADFQASWLHHFLI